MEWSTLVRRITNSMPAMLPQARSSGQLLQGIESLLHRLWSMEWSMLALLIISCTHFTFPTNTQFRAFWFTHIARNAGGTCKRCISGKPESPGEKERSNVTEIPCPSLLYIGDAGCAPEKI